MMEERDLTEQEPLSYEEAVDLFSRNMTVDMNVLLRNPTANFTDLNDWLKCVSVDDSVALEKENIIVEVYAGKDAKLINLSQATAIKDENEKASIEDLFYSLLLTDAKLKASLSNNNAAYSRDESNSLLKIIGNVFPSLEKSIEIDRKLLQETISEIFLNKYFDQNKKFSLRDLTILPEKEHLFGKAKLLSVALLPIILSACIGVHLNGSGSNNQPAHASFESQVPTVEVAAISVSQPGVSNRGFYKSQTSEEFTNAEINTLSPSEKQKESTSKAEQLFLAAHEFNSGDRSKNDVMITYDDGGSESDIERLMNLYDEYGAKATFFVPGVWLEEHSKFAKEMIERGFEIGCHGWDHTDMSELSNEEVENQIKKFIDTMANVDPDYKVKFIRFPFGARNDMAKQIAAEYGLQSVMWGEESGGTSDQTFNNVMKSLRNGTIVLSHSTRPYDLSMAAQELKAIKDRGYNVVTVSMGMKVEDMYINP